MAELGLTQLELAERLNAQLHAFGHRCTIQDRTVRYWLTGKTRWPHPPVRAALEAVFDCLVTDLGFVPPPGKNRTRSPEDDPVRRRHFLTAATATSAAVPAIAAHRVGMSDVRRLQARFAEIVADDHRHGGRIATEHHATALAREALALQQRSTASSRVRSALYAAAAAFTSSAMWAATDGRRFEAAEQYRDHAAALAAMSGDPAIQFRIWSHAGSLYRLMGRPADAIAANDVARNLAITRRDPMFASLGHARHAAILGLTGDYQAVTRGLGHAQDALDRADPEQQRPLWLTAFYDQAELDSLALSAYLACGRNQYAEARAHRSLAARRRHLRRSQAITTARLARAQLGQGDLEPAVATAATLLHGDASQHPRVAGDLDTFSRVLRATAPTSSAARTWDDHLTVIRKASR
jgi:tetratricopeptide (TPR) repeat protein